MSFFRSAVGNGVTSHLRSDMSMKLDERRMKPGRIPNSHQNKRQKTFQSFWRQSIFQFNKYIDYMLSESVARLFGGLDS